MKKTIFVMAVCAAAFSAVAGGKIRVHSHRGETDFAPQNTAEAIKLAYDMGSLMIETDFWQTKDGSIVCVHARHELKNLWGIDKDPRDLTAEEIKSARLAHPERFDKKYADCRLPMLDDILAVIPKDKKFELEVKWYGKGFADKVDAARKKAGLKRENILITSFSADVVKDFKSKYPDYETMLILSYNPEKHSPESIISTAKRAGVSQVALGNYRKIDREFVRKIQDAGFKVGVWQVQNLDDLAYAAKIGANRVCSDHAYRLRSDFKRLKTLDFK